ncbi:MAG: hypothetical protein KBT03_07670 [Bacteroidales bacterium]|nr:hypothetical protein [Candidatus Scybalousia scybalohippi]
MKFIDYNVSKNCNNEDSYGCVCVKCGKCGRKFKDGILVKEGKKNVKKSRKSK